MWFEIFSLCCSMLIEQLIDIKKMRTVNMKFTTDPLNEVFSFEQQIAQKILQIKNESSYCQRRSLHGFQISHFICNRFCCQLWLWSIQNHTRDSWKKLGIWADALFFGQIVHFDLMFCTGLDLQNVFYSYAFFFTQRPIINDRKIEQSNECCYVQWQVLAKSCPKFTSRLQAPKFTYH